MSLSMRRIVIAAGLAALAGSTMAATLPADGSQIALSGTSVAAQPKLAGTVVEDLLTPFSYRVIDDRCGEFCTYSYDFAGSLQSRVVKAVDGSYDFYWRIQTQPILSWIVSSRDPDRVEGTPPGFTADLSWAALSGFVAPEYRADWRTDGLGNAAPRTAALGATGPVFYFSERVFDELGNVAGVENSTLQSGGESRFLFLDTDARNYAPSATMQLHSQLREPFSGPSGGYFSVDEPLISTFAPAPIPEPETWAMMLAGLGLIAAVARRRASKTISS